MRFVTCRLPDGVEDPAILSQDGTQVWPLSWLGLSYETLSDAIPFLTPQVRFGLQLAISGIPALPVEAVTLQSPIPCPAQDVVCLGINYMAHSDEAEKYSADAFSTQHQDAIYFSKRVSRAVPDGGFIEAHTDLVQKLDYECELAVVLGKMCIRGRENTALHLMHLYLKPECRGKAIGRDIVQTCERLAKGEGKGRVWCTIHALSLIHISDAHANCAVQDGSLVMGNLMLAAASLGLGSCWINRAREEFDSAEGKALLKKWGIEGDWIGVGHCILGYPAAEPKPAAPRKPDYIVKV